MPCLFVTRRMIICTQARSRSSTAITRGLRRWLCLLCGSPGADFVPANKGGDGELEVNVHIGSIVIMFIVSVDLAFRAGAKQLSSQLLLDFASPAF